MLLDLAWAIGRPLIFRLDAETAHRAVLERAGAAGPTTLALVRALAGTPRHGPVRVGGLTFRSPIGLAAGLDKDGEAISLWDALGFGFIEVGTVTPRPQPGNPQPRLFRLVADHAIINRMGFNNGGLPSLRPRLQNLRESGRWPSAPVGVNIGKNKDTPNDEADADYVACATALRGFADWFTVNVSSPNTPGLRALQEPARLGALLERTVTAAGDTPVFLKLAPDLEPEALAEAVDVAVRAGCAGVVATNTTISRPGATASHPEPGGLSGAPLWPLAFARIGQAIDAAAGRVPVIGVGGVSSPAQARALLERGCAALQVYTGFIYEGPALPIRLDRGLAASGLSHARASRLEG